MNLFVLLVVGTVLLSGAALLGAALLRARRRREQAREQARGEAEARLRALAARPAPSPAPEVERAPQAMCYSRAELPPAMQRTLEFICPDCQERTRYPVRTSEAEAIEQLPALRKEAARIRGVEVRIDARPLCVKCRRPATERALELVVRFADGSEIRTATFEHGNLVALREALCARAVRTEERRKELVEQLLGIKPRS